MANKERLYYFDNFRAIAIAIIVLGHCYTGWDIANYYEKVIANSITGGTALFVFISGFFLHHIFYRRNIGYVDFIIKKFVAVGLPYLVLSSSYMILYFFVKHDVPTHSSLEGSPIWEVVITNFVTGRTLVAYWYIPFAHLIFALTPFFYSFIKSKVETQIILTVTLFILSSTVFWRPIDGMNPIHSVLYFTPFYLLGIIFSLNFLRFIDIIIKYKALLFLMWVGCLFVMNSLAQVGNLSKGLSMSFEGIDLMVMQKIILIFLLIAVLYESLNYKIKILDFIAKNSFPIFFIHGWVLALGNFVFEFKVDNFFEVFVVFLLVMGVFLVVSVTVKAVLNEKSKFVIGV